MLTYPSEPPRESVPQEQANPETAAAGVGGLVELPEPAVWKWWGALLLVVGILPLQIVVGIFAGVGIMIMREVGSPTLAETWMMPVITFSTTLSTLGLLLTVRRWTGAKPLWDRRDLKDWRNWLLALAALVIAAGANIARMILERDPAAPELNQQILAMVERSPSTPWAPLLTLGIAVVVLAPLTEEWLFRGILMPALQRALGARRAWAGVVAAVLISSLIFGLLHWPVWWVPGIYGVVLALLSLRMRSLAMPMLVHGAINLSVFMLVLSAT